MPKEKSCGTIVYLKGKDHVVKYLLLHYSEGHWEFPKGHVEKNEKEEQTALRELAEETAIIEVEMQEGFRHSISYFFKRGNETVFKEVVFFLCLTRTSDVTLSNEHIGFAWLTYDKAISKLKFKSSRDVLSKANEFVEGPLNKG